MSPRGHGRFVARLLGGLVAVALLGAACGGSERPLSATAEEELAVPVTQLRVSAASRDDGRFVEALRGARERVGDLRARGEISEERATQLLAALDDVEAGIPLITTTTTTTTTTTRPPPDEDDEDDGSRKGKTPRSPGRDRGDDD